MDINSFKNYDLKLFKYLEYIYILVEHDWHDEFTLLPYELEVSASQEDIQDAITYN